MVVITEKLPRPSAKVASCVWRRAKAKLTPPADLYACKISIVRTAFVVLNLGIIFGLACKSEEDRLREWRQEVRQRIEHTLPSPSECDHWENWYWIMVAEIERTTAEFTRQMTSMASNPYTPEGVVQVYARQMSATIDSLYAAFHDRPGWTEKQSKYCEGRYAAERRANCTRVVDMIDFAGPDQTFTYGFVDYCITEIIE